MRTEFDPVRFAAAAEAYAAAVAAGSKKPCFDAANATGIPQGTLRRWASQGRFVAPADDILEKVAAAFNASKTRKAAAARIGMSTSQFYAFVKVAAARGLCGTKPVLPGFRISQVSTVLDADGNKEREFIQQKAENTQAFAVPEGHRIKGISSLVDRDGNVVLEWRKTKEGEVDPLATIDILKNAMVGYETRHVPVPTPDHTSEHLMNFFPCNDWHVGMDSWRRETGTEWGLAIAERTIGQGIVDTISRSPRAAVAVILGGGDLTHADNANNETARSKNKLDVDGKHPAVTEAAGRLMVLGIDTALAYNGRVIVRILKGNHDPETAAAIGWYLHAWYRNEPRVEVDLDQSLFWKHQHGKVMLAATHGDQAKLGDMPGIMAHRWAQMWGNTLFRYAHGFHVHHHSKVATEGNGVICESHQAPIPQDAWHFGAGFLSGRSLQSITYHRAYGEVSRVRVAMLDAGESEAA